MTPIWSDYQAAELTVHQTHGARLAETVGQSGCRSILREKLSPVSHTLYLGWHVKQMYRLGTHARRNYHPSQGPCDIVISAPEVFFFRLLPHCQLNAAFTCANSDSRNNSHPS